MKRKTNRIISLILTFALVFSIVGVCGIVPASAKDACGYTPAKTMTQLMESGENAQSGEAYSISGYAELDAFASYVNSGKPTAGAIFYLTQDIKMHLDKDTVWLPIGISSAFAFSGVFDGCGFAITSFNNSSASNNYAIFGYVSGNTAVIKNLGVEGELTGGSGLSGIVAQLNGGSILNCWSSVDINGTSNIGGIAAINRGGKIANCCNYGYINGGSNTGALVGLISDSGTLEYSYYVYYSADRACGNMNASSLPSVYRFASSSTEVLTEKIITVGKEKTDNLIKLLNEWIDQEKKDANYRDWLFDTSAQGIARTDGRYPSHEYPGYIAPVESIYTATASMTALFESDQNAPEGTFYSISSAQELVYFMQYVNTGYNTTGVTFFLTADISMPVALGLISSVSWQPIAASEDTPFCGVFDGQGYVITDMLIEGNENYQGLFAYVNYVDACIKNVGLIGKVYANDSSAGIVGYLMSGNVINCWFDGSVTGDDKLGGIVGRCDSGNITNCASFASIVGNKHIGGIVGQTGSGANIKYCYYTSDCSTGCGDASGTQTAVIAFDKSGSDYTLERSVTVGSASGVKLLNVLNHWVTYLALDSSYRFWKIDDTAAGIARIQGNHPTHLFPGDGSGVKHVDEPYVDVDSTENPYNVIYAETATMTELYDSGEDVLPGGHYSISSGDELALLAQYVKQNHATKDATFYLTKDIDISVQCLGNNSEGWLPIGCDARLQNSTVTYGIFRGNFDGCGYTVTGLYIYNEKGDNVGLFGQVRGSTIKNLGVVGAIVGEFNCGGIAGKVDDGTIENCWTAVSIQSESETGGIAGRIDNTTIINCASYGSLLCYGGEQCDAGGIFGDAIGKSTVTNCYYTKDNVAAAYNSISKNCVVDIIPFTYGFENDDYYCTLERAAAVDDVTTTSLLDALNAWVHAKNNGQYSGWYNSNVIINVENGTSGHFPRLMNPKTGSDEVNEEYCGDYTATSSVSALYSTKSDGIEGCCYSINGLDDLIAFQKYVNEGYKTKNIIFFMTRDVDMSAVYSADTDKSWTPIGNVSEPFQGIFDGQGYTVKYIYINTDKDDQGLFGHVNQGALIKNLGICGVIRANVNAGSIVGDFNFSTIANCWSSCQITAAQNAGGLVGGANMGTIVNSTNYGVVVNSKAYGAIAGFAVGTTIKNCYYLYGTCSVAWGEGSTPIASGVTYFNGTSAACILHESVDVEGTSTRNALSALKLYVDAHPETNYCYWTVGNTEEYVLMGVALFPVLISASNTMGNVDYKEVQAYFADKEYYSVVKAVNAANDSEGGGDVTLATNSVLRLHDDITLDDDVRLLTGDYSIVIKSVVKVKSMQQLLGTFILKEGGSIYLWDDELGDYKLFMYSKKNADPTCNSEMYSTESVTFSSMEVDGGTPQSYNLSLHDGQFIVNSTLDSGNPHSIPGGSTLTIEKRATLNVRENARIRTTGGAKVIDNGTIIIGNATLDPNGGEKMVGIFEDNGGTVTLPFIYRDGYTLRYWSDGINHYKAGSTADITKATTLTAQWSLGDGPDPYPGDDNTGDDKPVYNIPITVIQSGGGKITPESIMAAKGENMTFSFKADTGYYIKSVLVDGVGVKLDDNNQYQLISISKAHTLIALYAQTTNSAYYKWTSPFEDVKNGDWYYDNVAYVASAGLFNGTDTNKFSPNSTMTREMVVTVLWRMSGSPVVPDNGASFSDVPKSNYAYNAVRWANEFGIVNGIGNNKFGYGMNVTREQLVTILFRYAKNYACDNVSLYDSTNILGYSDVMSISKGMTQPFQWAIGAGIINGASPAKLDPKGTATRAQVAAIFSRYCNRFMNTVPVFN